MLAEELTTGDWHGWYNLMGTIASWKCNADETFEITLNNKYYPLLQELSYIRPLRMLSPAKFVGGASSNPLTQNSCPTGWNDATSGKIAGTGGNPDIVCAGITGIVNAGTGRWKYVETTNDANGDVATVKFARNTAHWDASAEAEEVTLVAYATAALVKAALTDGTLDAVVGAGVLDPADVEAFRVGGTHSVSITAPLQNRIVVMNTAKAPTDDINTRKMMIHAVNKAAIIDKELAGIDAPVDSLFPKRCWHDAYRNG